MKIVKCERCGEIFFIEDEKKETWRSFEDFCCIDCNDDLQSMEE